jgi:predicted GNAT family N-acyltransferase
MYQMAVAESHRRQGLGTRMVRLMAERLALEGFESLYLHAREHVVGFYRKLGCSVASEPFMEIGIPHVRMEMRLSRTPR